MNDSDYDMEGFETDTPQPSSSACNTKGLTNVYDDDEGEEEEDTENHELKRCEPPRDLPSELSDEEYDVDEFDSVEQPKIDAVVYPNSPTLRPEDGTRDDSDGEYADDIEHSPTLTRQPHGTYDDAHFSPSIPASEEDVREAAMGLMREIDTHYDTDPVDPLTEEVVKSARAKKQDMDDEYEVDEFTAGEYVDPVPHSPLSNLEAEPGLPQKDVFHLLEKDGGVIEDEDGSSIGGNEHPTTTYQASEDEKLILKPRASNSMRAKRPVSARRGGRDAPPRSPQMNSHNITDLGQPHSSSPSPQPQRPHPRRLILTAEDEDSRYASQPNPRIDSKPRAKLGPRRR